MDTGETSAPGGNREVAFGQGVEVASLASSRKSTQSCSSSWKVVLLTDEEVSRVVQGQGSARPSTDRTGELHQRRQGDGSTMTPSTGWPPAW
jgi:hypothetical protein